MQPQLRPGDQLREIRNRLGVTTREVEVLSSKIAHESANKEYYISNAWLTQLENKNSVPSIFKLFSLSVIYRIKFTDLLTTFGISLADTMRYQMSTPLDNTHLAEIEALDTDKTLKFPVRFDRGFSLERTNLISRMVEVWDEVPLSLLRKLDVRRCQYGYIGMEDCTMYPLLRPGAFVQIDGRMNRPHSSNWRSEFDRPIYFVELRDSYACSWVELNASHLTLVPHPLSPSPIMQYAYPNEAEIIGQVTGVAMRLVSAYSDA